MILEKLSYDELRLIFNLFSLKEQIKCRRVCKTFRSVDSRRLRELFVFDKWIYENKYWFQSDRPTTSGAQLNLKKAFIKIKKLFTY